MTVKELMEKGALRDRLSDEMESGYENNEIISYINDAISFIWDVCVMNDYYEVIGDITLTNQSTPTPDDFYKITNMAPVVARRDTLECYDSLPQVLRYYKRPQYVSSVDDQIPFKNEQFANIINQFVVVLAMSNHGFDMQTEEDFVEAIVKIL